MTFSKGIFLILFFGIALLAQEAIPVKYASNRAGQKPLLNALPVDSLIIPEQWQWKAGQSGLYQTALPAYWPGTQDIILQTHFGIKSSAGYRLVSHGILGSADIYLNGKFLHLQPNDGIAFSVNLPRSLLKKKDNLLELRFHSPGSVDLAYPRPVNLLSEKQYLGILRPLYIEPIYQSPVAAPKYHLDISGSTPRIDIEYQVDNNLLGDERTKRITFDEQLLDPTGKIIVRTGTSVRPQDIGVRRINFNIDSGNLWSPENPAILTLRVRIRIGIREVYRHDFKFGVRQFTVNRNGFFLNGRTLKINGINYHQNPLAFVNKNYYSELISQLRAIRQAGFNSIRFLHTTPGPSVFHLADSLGLLIFPELPIWRYPVSLFSNDYLMEFAKDGIRNLQAFYQSYASFVTLGTGQEIPLHHTASQKFMLILKTLINSNLHRPCYLSPLPMDVPYSMEAADFYLIDIYAPLQSRVNYARSLHFPFLLWGKLGFNKDPQLWFQDATGLNRKLYLSQEKKALNELPVFKGGFWESFTDWYAANPTHFSLTEEDHANLIAEGLFTDRYVPKTGLDKFANILQETSQNGVTKSVEEDTKTNFFSILLFISLIIFLTISRKNKRLRENLIRSLKYPYGFFVDMRERRIIPIFNSILVGLFASIILSSGCAAFFYFYRNSVGLHEAVASILLPLDLYDNFLIISHSLAFLTITFTILFLLYPVFISLILKFISFFTKETIRYRQGLAIGLWSGVPLFFLLPVSMVSYQVIYHQNYETYLLIALALFVLWTHLRILNGIRVLFFARPIRVLIVMLLSYAIPIIIFWAVFHPEIYWLDYLKLLLDARNLF